MTESRPSSGPNGGSSPMLMIVSLVLLLLIAMAAFLPAAPGRKTGKPRGNARLQDAVPGSAT